MYYTNENLRDLVRIFDQNERKDYLRLDLNENPGGLSQDFINDVLKSVDSRFISEYPETLEFTQKLAKFHNTDISKICLTNGSSEAIRQVIEAFTSPNGKIVGVTPSYFMFQIYAQMYGRQFVPVEYSDDLQMPIERILEKMTDDIQLLILLNPNNPIGNVYTREEMEKILDYASEQQITVLIDEAYMYFYPMTFMDYALNREHVFVTRTFSKLFSLAGCRLGYVVGWSDGIKLVQKLSTPHNTNAFAMLFAQRIIEKDGMIEELVNLHKEGKKYLVNELKKKNYKLYEGQGNFVFIQPRLLDADEIVEKMKNEKKILIKSYSGIGNLGKVLRVTTGEKKYMETFLNALLEIDSQEN